MKEFGQISGYKVNFTKSEIMPLGFLYEYEPDFVKPFCWAPNGFTYMGAKITPKISQLYAENVNPMVKHIKEEMLSWRKLPVSFLGRVNLSDYSPQNYLYSIYALHISEVESVEVFDSRLYFSSKTKIWY